MYFTIISCHIRRRISIGGMQIRRRCGGKRTEGEATNGTTHTLFAIVSGKYFCKRVMIRDEMRASGGTSRAEGVYKMDA